MSLPHPFQQEALDQLQNRWRREQVTKPVISSLQASNSILDSMIWTAMPHDNYSRTQRFLNWLGINHD